jgi:hypothetical protein
MNNNGEKQEMQVLLDFTLFLVLLLFCLLLALCVQTLRYAELDQRWGTQLGCYTLQYLYTHPFRRTVQLAIFAEWLQRTLVVELLHPVEALVLARALVLSPATQQYPAECVSPHGSANGCLA